MLTYVILIFVSSFFSFAYYLAKILGEGIQPFPKNEIIVTLIEALIGLIIGICAWNKWGKVDPRSNAKAKWEKVRKIISTKQVTQSKKEK